MKSFLFENFVLLFYSCGLYTFLQEQLHINVAAQISSLACNLLKMGIYFNNFKKNVLGKNPVMRLNQIAANVNAPNHFHF